MAALTLTQTPTSKFAYLYPEDDGCDIDCFPFGSTANWSCVDDTVDSLTPDETYVFMDGASTVSDVYKPVDHGTLSGTINYVKGCCRAKSDQFPPAHDFVYRVLLSKDNACTNFAASRVMPLSTGFTTFENSWRENPFTSAAFTWGDIDNLQVGFEASSPAVIVSPSVLLPIGVGDKTDITDVTTGYKHWEAVRAERPLTQVSEDGAAWKYDLYEFIMGGTDYHSSNISSINKFGNYVVTTDHSTSATHIYQWNEGRTQYLAKTGSGGYVIESDGANHYFVGRMGSIRVYTYNDTAKTLTIAQTYALVAGEFSYSMVYEDGYLYVAAHGRLLIFSVAANGTLTLATSTGTDTHGIAYDGTYIYGVNGTTLKAYSFDSVTNVLTEIDSIACDGEHSLACDRNGRIFAPIGNAGLKLFSFDGATLTLEDTIDNGGTYARVAYSGGFIHTHDNGAANRLRAYSYTADTLALVGQYTDSDASIYSFSSQDGLVLIEGDTHTGFILSFNGAAYKKMHDVADGMLPKYIDDNIASVSVIAKMGKEYDAPDGADIRGRMTIKTHATEYPMTDYWKLEYPFRWYAHTWTTNPNTSAAWTLAEVKALQAGIGLYGTGTKYAACSVCQIVVAATSNVSPEIHTSKAYLKINYTPPASSCSLTTAKQVSTNHARNIKMLNFWTGKREVYDDLTRSEKSMVVTGSEYYTGACDRVICVRDMARIGEPVTITGFALAYFNGVYRIKQFGWKKVSEKPEHYEWIIALEDTEL